MDHVETIFEKFRQKYPQSRRCDLASTPEAPPWDLLTPQKRGSRLSIQQELLAQFLLRLNQDFTPKIQEQLQQWLSTHLSIYDFRIPSVAVSKPQLVLLNNNRIKPSLLLRSILTWPLPDASQTNPVHQGQIIEFAASNIAGQVTTIRGQPTIVPSYDSFNRIGVAVFAGDANDGINRKYRKPMISSLIFGKKGYYLYPVLEHNNAILNCNLPTSDHFTLPQEETLHHPKKSHHHHHHSKNGHRQSK